MKRIIGYLAAALVVAATSAAHADSMGSMGSMMSSAKPTIYTPATIPWTDGTGPLKGFTVAYLMGDPTKPGPWRIRLKIPAGTKFPVHFHADSENLTVISGAFWAAIGTKYDASKLTALTPGSFAWIPAGLKHYAATKVDTVIELGGSKPFSMEMGN